MISVRSQKATERPENLNFCIELTYIKVGCHLRVTIGHLRVTMGHLRLTIGYLKATVVHIRVTIDHLRLFFT